MAEVVVGKREGGRVAVLNPIRRAIKLVGLLSLFTVTPLFCLFALLGFFKPALQAWARLLARALWVRVSYTGVPVPDGCLLVSNHVGYLDPIVLSGFLFLRYLAKSEIEGWPLLGALGRRCGAFYVERERPRSVATLVKAVASALAAGDRILLFPEAGVSPDGLSLAEFRPMLFESCLQSGRPAVPAALCYLSPRDPHAWAWFDNSSLSSHLWTSLLPAPAIRVELRVGEPLVPQEGEDRKQLAMRAQEAVRGLLTGSVDFVNGDVRKARSS